MAGGMSVRNLWTSFKAKTDDFDRGMDRAKAKTEETKRSIVDAGRSGSKAASIAGAGFSSLAAGIAASQASAESFETSMVSAAASVAAAFGAGGPIGAAMAVGAISIGLIVGAWKDTKKAAEEAEKAQIDAAKKAFDEAEKSAKRIKKLKLDQAELDAAIAGKPFDRKRIEAQGDISAMARLIQERSTLVAMAQKKAEQDAQAVLVALERRRAIPRGQRGDIISPSQDAIEEAERRSKASILKAQGMTEELSNLRAELELLKSTLAARDAMGVVNRFPADAAYVRRLVREPYPEGYSARTMGGGSRIIELQKDGNGYLRALVDWAKRVETRLGTAR